MQYCTGWSLHDAFKEKEPYAEPYKKRCGWFMIGNKRREKWVVPGAGLYHFWYQIQLPVGVMQHYVNAEIKPIGQEAD